MGGIVGGNEKGNIVCDCVESPNAATLRLTHPVHGVPKVGGGFRGTIT